MALQVKQEAKRIGDRQWQWSVWLDGPELEMDRIEEVEYVLHPTFPNPVKHIKSRANQFRLDARGWGEFRIYIKVTDHDGGVEKLNHWLKLFDYELDESAPVRGAVPQPAPAAEAKMPLAAEAASPATTTAFISYSVADAPLANALMQALNKLNIEPMRLDDMAEDKIIESALARKMSKVEAAVVVVSDRVSPWISSEIETLKTYGVDLIIPVFIAFSERFCPEVVVKIDRRLVPIEHRPLESALTALDGDAGYLGQEAFSDALPARRGPYINVLEINPFAA